MEQRGFECLGGANSPRQIDDPLVEVPKIVERHGRDAANKTTT